MTYPPDPVLPIHTGFAILFWIGVASLLLPKVRRTARASLILPPATTQAHLGSLDAWRGLAALFVAIFHTWQWPRPALNGVLDWVPVIAQGNKAVPMFVCLSGLLIYRSLRSLSTIDGLRRYVTRRFLRIFPVYAVTAAVAIVFFVPPRADVTPLQMAISDGFMLRSLGSPFFAVPQTWSLYVEVLFYVIAPLYALMVRDRPITRTIVVLTVLVAGDIAGPRELTLWKYFCFGVIAAEMIERWKPSAGIATLVAAVGLLIVISDINYGYDWIGATITRVTDGALRITGGHPASSVSLGVGVLLLLVGSVRAPAFSRVLESTPLRVLGSISYSLFMWHALLIAVDFRMVFNGTGTPLTTAPIPPVPGWVMPMILVPGLLAVSVTSFLILERPFLLRRHRPVSEPTATRSGPTS